MKKVVGLQAAATAVGLILIGTTYITLRNRKRDGIAKSLLAKLNTKLNPITKGLSNEAALDVNYADKVLNAIAANIVVLKESTAIRYANEIHKAFRPWYIGGDLEEKVYAVFRNLKDKVQVSQVAKAYQGEYKLNLRDQLKDRFDKDEIKTVLRIIERLPKYRKL
ncbi:hypothetical protein HN014_04165 [Aquimarina sp. TRL1]|uniref:hypothetical protein n=1 Tax=Aquimarina sp. (strain TRL1) TaxID=2736252 RepID=UPI0015885AC1|nr:hypothetical protein [Aquimarina sp. TRL1]QKX04133.1 hypothetical protein HN014_04165 [Aquimarina sp. TRL1]